MDHFIRIKLEVATRVRDFCRAHLSDSPRFIAILARLVELVTRAEALMAQEVGGHLRRRTAVMRRKALRREVHDAHLVHLVAIAQGASTRFPELAARFRLPKVNVSHKKYLAAVQDMAGEAAVHRDIFITAGMPETFLEDLNTAVAEYQAVVTERYASEQAHIGARADLKAVSDDLMALIIELDAINRYRFRDNPEILAAWESARNAAWPGGTPSTATPPQGGVSPAA
jgi:hypothetical protein